MSYHCAIGQTRYSFQDLKTLMAKATPLRSGDCLAGIAAENASERVAAQRCLAEVPLKRFLNEALIPYEQDEVTRLILDSHVAEAFAPVSHLMVGGFSQLEADLAAAGLPGCRAAEPAPAQPGSGSRHLPAAPGQGATAGGGLGGTVETGKRTAAARGCDHRHCGRSFIHRRAVSYGPGCRRGG